MRALLVLGRSGQVAQALARLAPEFGYAASFVGRAEADLAHAEAASLIARHDPALIINAAGYTAVDKAESEPEDAFALNGDMPGRFARAAAAAGVPFVHISTDSVFDGGLGRPYREDDARAPINVYGASKAAGEDAVLAAGGASGILRTAWVYGPDGANFVPTMLRLARERDALNVVGDQYGSPTWAEDVARACLLVGAALVEGRAEARGVFHAAGGGGASRAELAQATFEISAGLGGPSARVTPVGAETYPVIAPRQADSRLDCSKLEGVIGWRPPPWRESLARAMPAILAAG